MSNSHATEDLHTRILEAIQTVRQPRPKQVRPIIVIGAGGIVRAAHLPAYEKAGFPVIGLMDQQSARAAELASQRGIPRTFSSAAEAVRFAPLDAIFDVAVPASQLVHILPQFNNGATILMQKPMGETLEEARIIRDLAGRKFRRRRKLLAAILSQQPRRRVSRECRFYLEKSTTSKCKQAPIRRGISGPFSPRRRALRSSITAFITSISFARGWATRKASWRAR